MRASDSSSGSSAAAQARATAEAQERARAAEERAQQAARTREETEVRQHSAEHTAFHGKQSTSTFDRSNGTSRSETKTSRSGKGGTVEITERKQQLANGAKTSFYQSKATDPAGHTKTRTSSTVTTASGKSKSSTRTEEGTEAKAKKKGNSSSLSTSATLASAESDHQVGNAKLLAGHANLPLGVKSQGSITGPGASCDASASAGLSGGNLKVEVDVKVDAHLLSAQGSLEKDVHFSVGGQTFEAKLKLGANAEIGANGELKLDLNIGTSGVSVDASANGFAGAEGSLTGSVELDQVHGKKTSELMEGSVTGSAYAGVKGAADVNVGYHNGEFGFHASVQGAVGVGVGLSFSGDVNVGNTAGAVKDVAVGLATAGLKDAARFAKNLASSGLSTAESFAKSTVHTVTSLPSSAWHDVTSFL